MASFGVNAPIAAIVISLFMAGLGLGSVAGGRLIGRTETSNPLLPLRLYALCELVIACSALAVPALLGLGRALLDSTLQALLWGSSAYYLCVGAYLAVVMLPWCICMGATTPLAMGAIRNLRRGSPRTFSYLYLANVIGATVGTIVSAFFLIELLGLIGTPFGRRHDQRCHRAHRVHSEHQDASGGAGDPGQPTRHGQVSRRP